MGREKKTAGQIHLRTEFNPTELHSVGQSQWVMENLCVKQALGTKKNHFEKAYRISGIRNSSQGLVCLKFLVPFPASHKPGRVVHIYNVGTQEMEVGGSVQKSKDIFRNIVSSRLV